MNQMIEITPKITLVQFSTQEELARTFLRFQEHYEGPEHRNKIFTLVEYRTWYAQQYGAFSYYTDWTGFNIPSTTLQAFRDGLFDPLTCEEQAFLDLFKNRTDTFYVIGTFRNEEMQHEVAHGLYYVDDVYRENVDQLLSEYDSCLEPLRESLLKDGYHPAVLADEMHAYILADLEWLKDRDLIMPVALHDSLQILYDNAIGDAFIGEEKLYD